MARRCKPAAIEPGIFRPGQPEGHGDVLKLFALAARAACAKPQALGDITTTLEKIVGDLAAPELLTAKECLHLWQAFVRTTQTLPPARWAVAGNALWGDLEGMGQRLDQMPLSPWGRLPEGIDDPRTRSPLGVVVSGEGKTVEWAVSHAHEELSDTRLSPLERARAVQRMLRELTASERAQLLARLLDAGVVNRGEVSMLTRLLTGGSELGADDEALVEVLGRVAGHLTSATV